MFGCASTPPSARTDVDAAAKVAASLCRIYATELEAISRLST
jgi:hypothetical protein